YAADSKAGPYSLIDSIADISTTSYTHIGSGADQQQKHYIVRTQSACQDEWLNVQADTISTIFLTSNFNSDCIELQWNALDNPLPTASNPSYRLYREFPIGSGFQLYQTLS